MSIKFTKLSSILLITLTMSMSASVAKAEKVKTDHGISVANIFNNSYFSHSGNTFKNSQPISQLNTIFGFRKFPELKIISDGKSVDNVYREFMAKQSQVGSPVKTKDLVNPYSTSLQENPSYIGY